MLNVAFKNLRIIFLRLLNRKSFPNEDFPLDEFGRVAFYKHPFYRDVKNKHDYFAQYYKETFVTDNVLDTTMYSHYLAEILEGEYICDDNKVVEISVPSLLPISLINKSTDRNYGVAEVDVNGNTVVLEGLKQNAFHYLPVNKKSTLSISSKQDFILGKPIALNQEKNKKKLVITIFIDGLSSKIVNNSTFSDVMPNTDHFFRKGAKFFNCFASSEWTLPSVASIVSGMYPLHHGVTNPKGIIAVGKNYKVLSEYFQEQGYLTTQICNNHRKNPSYGYVKGFDRTLYKRHMSCDNVITNALEHLDTFENRDNYLWLSFFDTHHHLDFIPDISSQKLNALDEHSYKKNVLNSVFLNHDQKLINWYTNEVHRLDRYLKILYDYISNKYEDDDVLISLISDHGQAYVGYQKELLSEQKLMTPMMFFGGGVESFTSNEIVQNIDYLPALLSLADIEQEEGLDGQIPYALGGAEARKFSVSESIYPNREYQAAIYDEKNMFYLKSKNKIKAGESCELDSCDYMMIDRNTKIDQIKDQSYLRDMYLKHLSMHLSSR